LKPIVKDEPKTAPEPEPEVKDEFTELFDLAKSSLSTKPQAQKKATPFDEEFFPSNNANEIYRQKINFPKTNKPASDPAMELFGKPQSVPQYEEMSPTTNVRYNPAPTSYASEIASPPGMAPAMSETTSEPVNNSDLFDLF